jgi:hypothetical protein
MSYVLPVATTSTLGGVKPDGVTITIDNGVISSKSSGSFISPTITGITRVQLLSEVVTPISGATGTIVHDFETGSSVFYHTNVISNFTANFTNVPLTNGRSYSITLIIEQDSGGYIPHAVSINNISQNLYWIGNVQPLGTALKTEFFNFNLIRRNDSWRIIAGVSTYG